MLLLSQVATVSLEPPSLPTLEGPWVPFIIRYDDSGHYHDDSDSSQMMIQDDHSERGAELPKSISKVR